MTKPKAVTGPPGNIDLVAEIHAAATVSAANPEANAALERLGAPRWVPEGWRWMHEWYETEIGPEGDDAEDDALDALANGRIRFAILTTEGTLVDFGAESAPIWRKESDAGALTALRSGKGGFTRLDGTYHYGHIFVRAEAEKTDAPEIGDAVVDHWFETEYLPKHRHDRPPPDVHHLVFAIRDRFPTLTYQRDHARRLRLRDDIPESWHKTGPREPHTGKNSRQR